MVRFKARLMLVQIYFSENANVDSKSGKVKWFPSRDDFLKALRNNIEGCFGTSASDASLEVQGKSLQFGN
jgi:hypothetical protein